MTPRSIRTREGHSSRFLGITPEAPPNLQEILDEAFVPRRGHWRARLGFAYVTTLGLESLYSAAEGVVPWRSAHKEWLVGLHMGVTEPAALREILQDRNHKVRVFTGSRRITSASLVQGARFHGKVISIGEISQRRTTCLLTSSANLTGAAISQSPLNYEAGLALIGRNVTTSIVRPFNAWWTNAWRNSLRLSVPLIDQYAEVRDVFIENNKDAIAGLDPPTVSSIETASFLWMEAGAMSGEARNQIEFADPLVEFFGPPTRARRDLAMYAANQWHYNRPLSYKTTTFDVEIWRLGLPTERMCGFEYPGRVVGLARMADEGDNAFEVFVTDHGSREHLRWRRRSHRAGYIGMTGKSGGSGRQFGYW